VAKLGAVEGRVAPGCAALGAVPTLAAGHADLHYTALNGGSFLPRAENSIFLSPKANKTREESWTREIHS